MVNSSWENLTEEERDLSDIEAVDPKGVEEFRNSVEPGLPREELISRIVRLRSRYHRDGDIGGDDKSWDMGESARQAPGGKPPKRPKWRADIDG
jgi:hypothetical protein